MIVMTDNKMIISTFQYARVAYTSEYPDFFDDPGLVIVWRNPLFRSGRPQINRWVYPLTDEGMTQASQEARRIDTSIRKQLEDRGMYYRR